MRGVIVLGALLGLSSGCGLIGYGGGVGEDPDPGSGEDPIVDPVPPDDPENPFALPSEFACGLIASTSAENEGEITMVYHDPTGDPVGTEEVERSARIYALDDCTGGVAFSLVGPASSVTFADVAPGEIIQVPAITSSDVLGVITVAASEAIAWADTYEFATGCQPAEVNSASQPAPAIITSDCVKSSNSVDILAVARSGDEVVSYDYLIDAPAPSGGEVLDLGVLDGWESGLRGTMVAANNTPGYFSTSFELTQSHWRNGHRFATETSTAQYSGNMYQATQLGPPVAFSNTTSAMGSIHFFDQEVIGVSGDVSGSNDPIDFTGNLTPFDPSISVNAGRTLVTVGYDDPLSSDAVVMISATHDGGAGEFRGVIFARAESVVAIPAFPAQLDPWDWFGPGAGSFKVAVVDSPSESYSERIEHAADITAFHPPLARVLFSQRRVDND